MNVTFWGVRGSIPTPQAENLGFGGETACVVLEHDGHRLVLDAGSGFRSLGRTLQSTTGPIHVLLSHFHWDHIHGIPYFAPLFMERTIRFYSHDSPQQLRAHLAEQMETPFFPVPLNAVRSTCEYLSFAWHEPFEIGPFRVTAFPLHHPQGSTAFRVEAGDDSVVYATDHELGDEASDVTLFRYAQGVQMLIADAQYTPQELETRLGFGHSTWQGMAELAARADVGRLILFHHDPFRSDVALEEMVLLARKIFPRTHAAQERTTIALGVTLDGSEDVQNPRASGSDASSLGRSAASLGLKEHTIRVLLVDDQRIIGEAVRRMLLGHVPEIELRFCQDAALALQVATEFQPSVILQDLVMPGVEGVAMIRAFRENPGTHQVPIIMLSSKEEASTKAESFAAGANDYIVKLPDKVELLARIQHHAHAFMQRLQLDEAYQVLVQQQRELEVLLQQVSEEKLKSESLLLNILPEAVALELKESGTVRAMAFPLVGVLFADFTNFTALSSTMTAQQVVRELHECFTVFDRITIAHRVEKLKTIGDGYMCVSGVPEPRESALLDLARAALEIRDYIARRRHERIAAGGNLWDVRIGLHCGPVVAGVVGVRKFAYDVWGDTVNTAARMESASAAGRVNISGAYRDRLPETAICEPRGLVPVKGKGDVEMFFLESL